MEQGDAADIVIATSEVIEQLIGTSRLLAGTQVPIGSSEIGLAVQRGAPKPDISSVEGFKRALLSARSIATSNPVGGGQSGQHLAIIFERLGIADTLRLKLRYGPGGPAGLIGLFLLRGEAEVGLQQMPELLAVAGIEVVGPIPAEIQSVTTFSAGLSTTTKSLEGSRFLIEFLTSSEAASLVKAKGLQPPR